MTARSSALVDWNAAADAGRRVGGRGPVSTPTQRDALRADLRRLVPEAESLVVGFTGLEVRGPGSRPWVLSRSTWVAQNLRGLQTLTEPLVDRIGSEPWSDLRRRSMGWQIGALLGYASRKVLGQYDVFLPADDDGLLYFVGPNILEAERRSALRPEDFRFWIAAHEATHRVQFGATPWLRGHLAGLVDRYLRSMELDPARVAAQVRRAAEQIRSGETPPGLGVVFLLLSDEQRELFQRMQGLMSLLEGHASYVMNEVARGRVADLERMRRAMRDRRRSIGGVERAFQRASGFELKVRQYDAGERFVRAAVGRLGMAGFNAVWGDAGNLPGPEEIAEPERWIARVGRA
ncbi:MAG: zinc-dependent metalloprotease [Actinomycetota bacterium]